MEIDILKWFADSFHSQSWLNYIMKYITYIGEFALGPIICALVLFLFKRTRRAGFCGCVALVINIVLVNLILKQAVDRARPWTEYSPFSLFHESISVREPTDSSFPSGHSAACFCMAAVLICQYKLKGLPALAVAVLVAISRIYLCMHYPTDVLAGCLIGSACGVGGYFLGKYLYKKLTPLALALLQKLKSLRSKAAASTSETVDEPSEEDPAAPVEEPAEEPPVEKGVVEESADKEAPAE